MPWIRSGRCKVGPRRTNLIICAVFLKPEWVIAVFIWPRSDKHRGKREFIQVPRLMEVFEQEQVAGAVTQAIRLGAAGFDAVKQLILCRIERRPPRLDLAAYPHLPKANVETTRTADYAALLEGVAA